MLVMRARYRSGGALTCSARSANAGAWRRVCDGVYGFSLSLTVRKWKRTFHIAIYRMHVINPVRKNYEMHLFDPNIGTWENTAIATNLPLRLNPLWHFIAGRGVHDKAIGELKSALAFHTIPTDDHHAKGAMQLFVVLTYNLLANFQIDTGLTQHNRTYKSTARWALKSIRTLRFELFNRAGQLVHPRVRAILRLQRNDHIETQYRKVCQTLHKTA